MFERYLRWWWWLFINDDDGDRNEEEKIKKTLERESGALLNFSKAEDKNDYDYDGDHCSDDHDQGYYHDYDDEKR